jgi:hypothetical protein
LVSGVIDEAIVIFKAIGVLPPYGGIACTIAPASDFTQAILTAKNLDSAKLSINISRQKLLCVTTRTKSGHLYILYCLKYQRYKLLSSINNIANIDRRHLSVTQRLK